MKPLRARSGVSVTIVPFGEMFTLIGTTFESSHGSSGLFNTGSELLDSSRRNVGGPAIALVPQALMELEAIGSEKVTTILVSVRTPTALDPGTTEITLGGSTSRTMTTEVFVCVRPDSNASAPLAASATRLKSTSNGTPTKSNTPFVSVNRDAPRLPAESVTLAFDAGRPLG